MYRVFASTPECVHVSCCFDVCISLFLPVCPCACLFANISIYVKPVYVCMCVCVCVCVYVYVYVCGYIDVYEFMYTF